MIEGKFVKSRWKGVFPFEDPGDYVPVIIYKL